MLYIARGVPPTPDSNKINARETSTPTTEKQKQNTSITGHHRRLWPKGSLIASSTNAKKRSTYASLYKPL